MPIQYPGNSISKAARAKAGGGFESAIGLGEGYIAFDVPVINHATTGGTIPVRLVRRRGSSGSVTVSLSASDKFRAQGVQSYAGESVTFADGEMTKIVNVPLNSITLDGEAHFYLNCTITNALIPGVRWHELNTLVIVDDGSEASDGVVLNDPTTQSIQDSCSDNTIVYVGNGTWDDPARAGWEKLFASDEGDATYIFRKTNLVVRNRPGESPVITLNNHTGFFVVDCEYVHIRGFEITAPSQGSEGKPIYCENYLGKQNPETYADNKYYYIMDNHIHHYYGGDNIGGIRFDDTFRGLAFNNKIHDGYDTRSNSNSITAIPYGLHSGVHGYRPRECVVMQNTIYNMNRAVYRKDPAPSLGMTNMVLRNLVYDCEMELASYEYAGTKDLASFDIAVFENIAIGSSAVDIDTSPDTGVTVSERALIYNNTVIDAGVFAAWRYKDIQFWNNLVVGGTVGSTVATSLDGREPGEITYADYNGYELDYRYIFGRNDNALFRSYDTFAAWQASDESGSTDNQAPANPDANGVKGAPVFVGVDDYHLDETDTLFRDSGRFGEHIGAYRLGHEQIGATI